MEFACSEYVKLLFCSSCLCSVLNYLHHSTLMLIFQYFLAKICCIYYNDMYFISVFLDFHNVVYITTKMGILMDFSTN